MLGTVVNRSVSCVGGLRIRRTAKSDGGQCNEQSKALTCHLIYVQFVTLKDMLYESRPEALMGRRTDAYRLSNIGGWV